jgi:hypothetical protein
MSTGFERHATQKPVFNLSQFQGVYNLAMNESMVRELIGYLDEFEDLDPTMFAMMKQLEGSLREGRRPANDRTYRRREPAPTGYTT